MIMPQNFYTDIPRTQHSLIDILKDERCFYPVPPTWDIVVTDVAGSTRAVEAGKYREVNLAAVSCIVSALNIARKMRIQIPFFFGGDGATILCPSVMTAELLLALKRIQSNARQNFKLDLRVGSVNAQVVYAAKEKIELAKICIAAGYDQAICLGNGLMWAEKFIKNETSAQTESNVSRNDPPLQGLECRWREIAPPTSQGEIVSLIVNALPHTNQSHVYTRVLELMESIYGDHATRGPVRKEYLSLISSYGEIKKELLIKYEKPGFVPIIKTLFGLMLASIIFKFNLATKLFDPTVYKQQLIAATDSLKIDGMLKTTIQGTALQRTQLIRALDDLEKEHLLRFGLFATDATVMTCYVADRNAGHVHFLDAKNGGYTQAATMLKMKIVVY